MSQSVRRKQGLPFAFFINGKPILGSGPYSFTIDEYTKDMIVR